MLNRLYGLLLLTLLILALLTSCDKDEVEHEPISDETVDVHVIMGQSNSIGRAYAYQLPEELQKPLEGCYIFNASKGKFEQLHAGVNTQSDKGQFGPVVMAAQLLRQHKKKNVYFVVAGVGNTQLHNSGSKTLKDWHPDSNELVPQAKQTIEKARKALVASGTEPIFKSITWWQGENDAMDKTMAQRYGQNEQALFDSLDQVEYLSGTKRVVYKIFSDMPNVPHAGTVNSGKAMRASSDKRTIKVIETNGYDRNPQDRLHATAKGQLQAGTDLFNAIKNL
jgi:hypothetical protein